MPTNEATIKELREMREKIDARLALLMAKRNEALSSISKVMSNFDISIQELTEYLDTLEKPRRRRVATSGATTPAKKRGRKPKSILSAPANIEKTEPSSDLSAQTQQTTQVEQPPHEQRGQIATAQEDTEELNMPGNF